MTGKSTLEPCSEAEVMSELGLTPSAPTRTAAAKRRPSAEPRTYYVDELIGGTICVACGEAIDESEDPPFRCANCRTLYVARARA